MNKYLENTNASYRSIAKSLKIPKTTVSRVISKFLQTKSIERKAGSGRKAGPSNPGLSQKVKRTLTQNPSLSMRDAAKKLGTSKSTVQKYKRDLGLRSFVVQKVPGRSQSGQNVVKPRARKLYYNFLTKMDNCIIMDDETYIKMDFNQLPGKVFYVSKERGSVRDKYCQKSMTKFAKKYLIWQAICSCGKKSKAFVTSGNINGQIYLEQCLKRRLLPFYQSHVDQNKCLPLFWPDLASCHYSKVVEEWYRQNNIYYVPKSANPPNCPDARPIEKFWAIIKAKLRKSKKEAKSLPHFKVLYKKTTETITEESVQTLMEGVKRTVRQIALL